MKSKLLLHVSQVLLLACFSLMSLPVSADEAEDIVNRVRDRLEDLDTFSCSFVWDRYRASLDRTSRIEGTLVMKRPYLLRVEYPGNVIVVDGKYTWTYLANNRQLQISDFVEGAQFPSPETIFRRYSASRTAVLSGRDTVNDRECDVIQLVPSDPDDVRVTVWIDRELEFPVKTVETAPTGDTSTHVLGNIELNEPVDDSLFTFQPPEGTTIIDLRE